MTQRNMYKTYKTGLCYGITFFIQGSS